MSPKQIGRYQVVEELANSARGNVYKAINPRTKKGVAIRTIASGSADLPRLRETLRRAQALDSPNIVRVQELGDFEGGAYVVTDYVEGRTLHALLAGEQMSLWDITDIGRQIGSAIDHAHSRRLAHTNLTPTNIMVEWDGTAKIMDYGLVTDPGESAQTGRNGDALKYVSPEQAGGEEPTYRSNLFSLGTMLYELVSGSKPFEGDEVATVLDKIIRENPAPPHSLKRTVDPRVSDVISKAMAKLPDERYQSGADLIRDLEDCCNAVAAPAPATPSHEPTKPAAVAPPVLHSVPTEPLQASSTTQATAPLTTNISEAHAPVRPPVHVPAQPVSPTNGIVQMPGGTVALPPQDVVAASQRDIAVSKLAMIQSRLAASAQRLLQSIPPERLQFTMYAAVITCLVIAMFFVVIAFRGTQPQPREQQVAQTEIDVQSPQPAANPTDAEVSTQVAEVEEPEASPAIERTHKRKLAALTTTASVFTTGQLVIDSSPQGAVIRLDGQNGPMVTPYTAAGLNAGVHSIVVSKPGYAPESRTVEIAAGQKASIVVPLKELGATVAISSAPAGATVLVDGNDIGRLTPIGVIMPKGTHTVVVRKAGYLPSTLTVELAPGQSMNLSPTLAAAGNAEEIRSTGRIGRIFGRGASASMGKLQIRTDPKGAQVAINDRVLDRTTPAEFAAPAGTYELTLMLDGYKRVQRTVTIVAGSTSVVNESLR